MPTQAVDVVIIGGGVMGLSTAYHLARRGCRNVVVLEKNLAVGGFNTGRCNGGIRHQFSTRTNVQMSCLSIKMFERFAEELDCPLPLQWPGYLFILSNDDDIVAFQRTVKMQHELGIATQWLSAQDLHERFPLFQLDDAVAGTFYHHDGLTSPKQVASAYAAAAQRQGVTLLRNVPALSIRTEHGRICEVVTPQGNFTTRIVVNATGSWAAYVGRMAGVSLPIHAVRHQILVTRSLHQLPEDLPVVIFSSSGLGMRLEGSCILAGTTDWTEQDGAGVVEINMAQERKMLAQVALRLPTIQDIRVDTRWAGFYDVTPDLQPIMGQIPTVEGFYCVAGFSGHGFTHSPASGLLISEEILDGRASSINIDPFRIERFQRNEHLVEQRVL